ncbi:LPXTG-motif cell wall anchor domain protein [Ligilactobacillus apodemi DSM 16634 = JCM 16172]|uniref:LPXTG-motif cell wall anchor domain protein n=1 Tax=Ligilactobacillus apodemi DSM 16634 = JCM 16172 TaxID=1423724 RepID=A0A0R1U3W9_9LACO|nr:LPXTG-motif cell wall anchor domain protein [Ligilactobacillus apodemi DSM 16634 = JCM 16172]
MQTATWTRTVTVDAVTGEVVSSTDWTSDKETYDAVTTPVINGYYADTAEVAAQTVTQENIETTVVYKELGKIVPVDPNGNEIPGAETPTYNNDPSDPTKGGITDVPEVPGYVPQVPSVTPENPGEDTPVVYVPVTPEAQTQTATITYVDSTTGETIQVDTVTGESGSTINYSTADVIKELEEKGYVLVEDGFPTDATFDDDDSTTQNYTVTLKHGEKTVTPDNPVTPGDPINPNDPDGPKWPAEAGEVSKDVTSTVHYVGAGDQTPADNVQTATWTRTVTVDAVTGEVVSSTDWTSDKETYDAVTTPVINGYYADTAEVAAQTVTQENIETTVVYKELGKVVPVDPNGNEIPGAETPTYNNDPSDPTKGGITDVPEVPGYVPQTPSVTPENPGEDTPVVYVPVTPEKQTQTAKIVYVDETTGETIETVVVTGKSGDKIDYSTADKIKELVEKGYVVVEDGFPTDATFDDNDAEDQVYVVKLGHDTAPVGPNNPHEPGTPINPNDPNGPKWPAADEYSKEYTSTVHFVDENGNKIREDDVQTSTWTRTLIVDKVTGEILNPQEPWTADKDSYNQVKVPVVEGYVADKAVVPGQATQQRNLETTVTYKKIGVIVPVDENGNEIPGAETPQYKNDPNDPTKVIVTDTPKVPGYNTDTPSVDPADPTANMQVVYKKVVTPAEPSEPTPQPQPEKQPDQQPQPDQQKPVVEPTSTTTTVKEQPAKATQAAKTTEELPQTGDSENNKLAALGATMVASLLGFAGLKRRKKDEKDNI